MIKLKLPNFKNEQIVSKKMGIFIKKINKFQAKSPMSSSFLWKNREKKQRPLKIAVIILTSK